MWEEDLLFPLWEKKTGMSEAGPTSAMRTEHRQIGQLLEAIHRKVAAQNPDSDQEEQALLDILGSHNRKEERALYPAIDQVASLEDREAVFQNMKKSRRNATSSVTDSTDGVRFQMALLSGWCASSWGSVRFSSQTSKQAAGQ